MVEGGQFVCDVIFSHKIFKSFIVEMSVIIIDYGSMDSKVRKNILFQELDNNFVVIVLQGMASTH